MDRMHHSGLRTLGVSENITNAAKLGSRIKWHFESNALYRWLFPETLPTTKETWNNYSLHTPRPGAAASHGEGTFDFLGVGGALQSRHYGMIIQDDLVGRKAIESPSIMEKTIEYHQGVVGAFDVDDKDHENPELVIGNRWAFFDLNSHIRENEPWFTITRHSAFGGCCEQHPADVPIFPEEFSERKLRRLKARLGNYTFGCWFLNNPSSPEDAEFKTQWLGFFNGAEDSQKRPVIVHKVRNGEVRKDLYVGHLSLVMLSDPNHAGQTGRSRHAIVVLGFYKDDIYLIDCFAEKCSTEKYLATMYAMAAKWRLNKVGLETIAAQKYLAHHIAYRNKVEGRNLRIVELRGEVEAPDGTMTRNKEWRIRNALGPAFENGRFWTQEKFQSFLEEYETFPKGKTVDILDAMAYYGQVEKTHRSPEYDAAWAAANAAAAARVNSPYSVARYSGYVQ